MRKLTFQEIMADQRTQICAGQPEATEVLRMAISGAQETIRTMRRDADKLHIDPHRVGNRNFRGGKMASEPRFAPAGDAYLISLSQFWPFAHVDVKRASIRGVAVYCRDGQPSQCNERVRGVVRGMEPGRLAGQPMCLTLEPISHECWKENGTLWTDTL